MKLCAMCRRLPRRAPDQSYCRGCYRAYKRTWQPPAGDKSAQPRARALRLLTTFLLSPRELSCHLGISTNHASLVLIRLWEQGICERWPHTYHSFRYRLRDAA